VAGFSLISAREQWLQADLTPSRAFFRFISNLFISAGGQGVAQAITVGASPFLYTAPASLSGNAIVSGGTVSDISISRDGATFFTTGSSSGMFPLSASDQLKVTWSVKPTMTFLPR